MNDVVETFIEVKLPDEEAFLKIKETLTRIGIASKKDKTLWQSVHILHKKGCYYIVHFKELFMLDGKETDFNLDDKARRNAIACLLEDWGLLKLVEDSSTLKPKANLSRIKIIKHSEKKDWILKSKYQIGK